jgi:hypothetical protein
MDDDLLNFSGLSFGWLDTDKEEFIIRSPQQHNNEKRSRQSSGLAGEPPKIARPNGTTPLLRFVAFRRVKNPFNRC